MGWEIDFEGGHALIIVESDRYNHELYHSRHPNDMSKRLSPRNIELDEVEEIG